MKIQKSRFYLLALIISLPIFFILDVLVGSVNIPLSTFFDLFTGNEIVLSSEIIIVESRIPKALTALLCGMALSVSGLLMQTLFRNPLAGPYILGISSGAGLGVALLVMGATFVGISISSALSIPIAAIMGSLAVLFILFFVSLKVKEVMTLLILGVLIGSIATALIGLIQFFTTDYQLKTFLIWTLGSLAGVSYSELLLIATFVFSGILLSFVNSKSLNAILLGEQYASTIGISVSNTRVLSIIAAGILAGTITAFCGPIGFVGIVVPHLARMLFQSADHKILIPGCILIGAIMLLISDLLSSLIGHGFSLPINSITSILGIPVIIWIIFNKRSISSGF